MISGGQFDLWMNIGDTEDFGVHVCIPMKIPGLLMGCAPKRNGCDETMALLIPC